MRPLGAHVSAAGGLLSALTRASSLNADLFQIFAGSPRTWRRPVFSAVEIDQFLKANQDPSLSVFIHALYLVNLATNSEELLKKSTDSLVSDLNVANSIQAKGVIFHIGSHQGRGFDSVKNQLIDNLGAILESTHNTPLLLENSAGEIGKVGSLEELSLLLHQINNSRLRLCLDTAHLFASGWNLTNPEGIDALAGEFTRLDLSPYLSCLHINESKSLLGSHQDRHANLGEGEIGLTGLTAFLHHSCFINLPLILEVPGFDNHGPDARNLAILREISF